MENIIMVELTEKEMAMIMESRAKEERQRKREAYVAELNDLIKRATKDGFTIAAEKPFKTCESVAYATIWNDAAGNFIAIR